MSIPKKIRREINVNNVVYEYCITDNSLYIRNTITGKEFKENIEFNPKWSMSIRPIYVKQLILLKDI